MVKKLKETDVQESTGIRTFTNYKNFQFSEVTEFPSV